MSEQNKRYIAVLGVLAIMAIAAFSVVYGSCTLGAYSVCLATMCAFVLNIVGTAIVLGAGSLILTIPANRGVSIPIRLDRPPRR